jgi:NADPH2 dehydrogenase
VAPSAIAFSPERPTPDALTIDEVERLIESFVRAAERAVQAGFKILELHGAHGYLIHQFFSPLSNKRSDIFGGNTDNRMRFSLDITKRIRRAIPETTLLAIRISGTEYAAGGYTSTEMTSWVQALSEAGIDMIHVSTGGGSKMAPPVWPGYQLSYAKKAREDSRLPVIGVGLLTPELAEFALQEGYCDFAAIGRGLLKNPNWAWDASMTLEGVPLVPDNLKRFFIKD